MSLLIESGQPNPYETLSFIVASGLGLMTIVQIFFGFRKDRRDLRELKAREQREARQAQARAGYELVDALFDDETGGPLLEDLDAGLENSPNLTRRTSNAVQTADTFARAFGTSAGSQAPELIAVRLQFDAVLYYLDRFEHAISAGVTTFPDVQASFQYYAKLLDRFAPTVDAYATMTGYERASAFLRRYPNWQAMLPAAGSVLLPAARASRVQPVEGDVPEK